MTIRNLYPDAKPSLLLDFAKVKALDPRVTFTRASSAVYYDGTTTAKAEENLLLASQELNNTTYWAQSGVTVTANAGAAPDGTTTAEKVIPTAVSSAFKELQQNYSFTSGLTYTFSVHVKADGYNFVQLLGTQTHFGTFIVNYDLSTGTETLFSAGTSTILSRSITALSNSWYRINVVATCISSGSGRLAFNIVPASNSARGVTWTGDGTSGVLAWGVQLEQRSSLTSYTATTTQFITRYQPALLEANNNEPRFDHDTITGESLGLLIEEQRTNLFTYSEQFDDAGWTKTRSSIISNMTVAPDGTLTADKLIESSDAGEHFIAESLSVTAQPYAISIYAKAGERSKFIVSVGDTMWSDSMLFDLIAGTATTYTGTPLVGTITNVGNGWYRCSFSKSASSSGLAAFRFYIINNSGFISYTGDGYSGIYIWGAQLEAGAFPTSYIKTIASQVTRAADSASMTGTNFSSWYRQDEGTFVIESRWFIVQPSISISYSFLVNKEPGGSTTTGGIGIWNWSGSDRFNGYIFSDSGVIQFNSDITPAESGSTLTTMTKQALAYRVNDAVIAANGFVDTTDTSVTLPTGLTTLNIGFTSSQFTSQYVKRLIYYPARLTTTELQALTR
jgi:hypothetical protein